MTPRLKIKFTAKDFWSDSATTLVEAVDASLPPEATRIDVIRLLKSTSSEIRTAVAGTPAARIANDPIWLSSARSTIFSRLA